MHFFKHTYTMGLKPFWTRVVLYSYELFEGSNKKFEFPKIPIFPTLYWWISSAHFSRPWKVSTTLASGIEVGPTFINFGFFSDPTAFLNKGHLDGYLLHRTCVSDGLSFILFALFSSRPYINSLQILFRRLEYYIS